MSLDDDRDDKDVLAAEYALGTLNAVDRTNVEMLLAIDPAFAFRVRLWERRLGVLDTLIAPVEPPAETWAAIKAQIGKQHPSGQIWLPPADHAASPAPDVAPPAIEFPPTPEPPEPPAEQAATAAEETAPLDESEAAETPQPPQPQPDVVPLKLLVEPADPAPAAADVLAPPAPSAEIIDLTARARAWRQAAIAAAAMAATLALFFTLRELRPDLMPAGLRPRPVEIVRTIEMPSQKMAEFVAVFQKDDASPAFLLTVDVEHHALSIRKVGAKPEAGKSYELWIIPPGAAAPRSLGVVGEQEFTVRRTLDGYDQLTLANATYAVSLEPAGGSPTGKPTGPALHGKLLQTTPPAFPSATP
jgi:anti-sigma-K factor RskA